MESEQVPAGSIVVGVDGSSSSALAAEWAAEQAALQRLPLVLVRAEVPPSTLATVWFGSMGIDRTNLYDRIRRELTPLLAESAAVAVTAHSDLEVHQVLRLADPRQTLLQESERAAAVVVGTRGHGPIRDLLLGSVSMAVSTHAHSPVVVVRDPVAEPLLGVVVGVEGLGHDRAALELGYRMADLHRLPLTAVHCFWDAVDAGEDAGDVDDGAGLDDRRAILADATADIARKHPDVATRIVLSRGFADARLVAASREAALVVVGHRRKPRLNEVIYGSLAPRVVERARCSVAVVPVTD